MFIYKTSQKHAHEQRRFVHLANCHCRTSNAQ